MEYELPEFGKGIREPTGILEPWARTDVVRDGEARNSKVFESGKCCMFCFHELVFIVTVSMGQ